MLRMAPSSSLKELEAARAKVAELEKSVAAELAAELRALPGKYGFASADEFIAAVRGAGGGGRGRRKGAAAKAVPGKRRKRAVITDETRAQVKKMVGEDKSGNEIAKALGISLPSVQNIKKALGLVKERK
jgi:DNA-binding NarL/FixJ family response regulator